MIRFINYLLDLLKNLVSSLVNLLPDSPFQGVDLGVLKDYIGYVNYFFPVHDFVLFLAAYVGAVLVWYGVRWVLRLARYIK